MIENTGGIGKPFDYTNYVRHEHNMEADNNSNEVADSLTNKQDTSAVTNDAFEWRNNNHPTKNDIRDSLKKQIEKSRKHLTDSSKAQNNIAKHTKFIGKVTYEFESYPQLDGNFDQMV